MTVVTQDSYLCVDAYVGCKECADLVGIDLYVFDENGAQEWLRGSTIERVTPSEYGSPNGGAVKSFEMFSMEDLSEAIQAECGDIEDTIAYDSWQDWVESCGVAIMNSAFAICQQRKRRVKG